MYPKQMLTKQRLIENLINYLPAEQWPFEGTKPYLDLCDAVWCVLKADADDRPMMQQALKHQRSIWEDFCRFEMDQEFKRIEDERIRMEAIQTKIEAMKPKEPKMSERGWGSI
jgi:hypothetical protein